MHTTQPIHNPAGESGVPILEAKEATARFGNREAVIQRASFTIESGSFVFLLGPSGSGKTTLLRLLFGDIRPAEGAVFYGRVNLRNMRGRRMAHYRREVSFIFQDFKLLPRRTVFENIALALRVTGASNRTIRQKVDEIIPRVGLAHRRDAYPSEISGGEQQRVSIARAMVNEPNVLLADEPTGNLDPRMSTEILDLFEKFNFRGTTVVVATHDAAMAAARRQPILRIERRRVIEDNG